MLDEQELGAATCSLRPFGGVAGCCDRCGAGLTGRRTRWCSQDCYDRDFEQHEWGLARRLALARDGWKCVQCGAPAPSRSVEVNHIEPRNGGGYLVGCHNHVDGLETLCHEHHVVVTNAQRTARIAAQGSAPSLLSLIEPCQENQ